MSIHEDNSERLTAAELDRYRDAEWALHDPGVQQRYAGEWVVAHQRQIIAHGPEPRAVAQEARRIVNNEMHQLVFCAPEEPDAWLQHSSDRTLEETDG
jgi:hypothetical protein